MKHLLQDGDVLICTSDRFIPTIIKLATKSKWTHTAQYFIKDGVEGVLEAQGKGVHFLEYNDWVKRYNYEYIIYRRRIINIDQLKERAFSKLGNTGYDYVSFAIKQPIKLLTGKWVYQGEKIEERAMICSELTTWTEGWRDYYKMTPNIVEEKMRLSTRYKLVEQTIKYDTTI